MWFVPVCARLKLSKTFILNWYQPEISNYNFSTFFESHAARLNSGGACAPFRRKPFLIMTALSALLRLFIK